jgi:hypothetical protein
VIQENIMGTELQKLLDAAKNVQPSDREKEAQRRSFAYGNTKIENSRITRELVDQEAEILKTKHVGRRG